MVATRAQLAAAAAARPAARLDGLPVDLLAHIALYAGQGRKRHESVLSKSGLFDLLALRGACRACVPAVRRAATDHALSGRTLSSRVRKPSKPGGTCSAADAESSGYAHPTLDIIRQLISYPHFGAS